MPWWTSVKGRENERHRTLVDAAIRINFAVNMGGIAVDDCGIFKHDPASKPSAENLLPCYLAKATGRNDRRRR